MPKLWEVTKLVRSKNAGPFVLTFDIMFDDPEVYTRVRDSGVLNKGLVARMYRQPEEEVSSSTVTTPWRSSSAYPGRCSRETWRTATSSGASSTRPSWRSRCPGLPEASGTGVLAIC